MNDGLIQMLSDLKEVTEQILTYERRVVEELFYAEEQIRHRLYSLYSDRYSARNEYFYHCEMVHEFFKHICYRSDEIESIFKRIDNDIAEKREEMNNMISCIKKQISDRNVDEQFSISYIQSLEYDIQYLKYEKYNYSEELMAEIEHDYITRFDGMQEEIKAIDKRI